MMEGRYSMKWVVQKTGLSSHVLRVWERRYKAVSPDRTDSNRRLYSDDELRRLEMLAILTRSGQGISQIAALPDGDLEAMLAQIPRIGDTKISATDGYAEDKLMRKAWEAVIHLDLTLLRDVLERAGVSFGNAGMSEYLMVPLIERIGSAWETGEISIAEEHAASAVIREVLFLNSRPFAESANAPGIVIATPAGQLHELGAALVASIARRRGWNVTYLGASLPAEEIARAVIRSRSIAVGLSIVYPADDPQLPDELRRLKRLLPDHTPLLIGGRAASSYHLVAAEIGATIPSGLHDFKANLESIREKSATGRIVSP